LLQSFAGTFVLHDDLLEDIFLTGVAYKHGFDKDQAAGHSAEMFHFRFLF
jgi:hypothetical protein